MIFAIIAQPYILPHNSGHWLLISSVTVSLQPPHSVTQQQLMACIQQQPVSAALYTALIKSAPPYTVWRGLKESEQEMERGIVVLSTSTIAPFQRQRFRLTHLAFNPPWKCIRGG